MKILAVRRTSHIVRRKGLPCLSGHAQMEVGAPEYCDHPAVVLAVPACRGSPAAPSCEEPAASACSQSPPSAGPQEWRARCRRVRVAFAPLSATKRYRGEGENCTRDPAQPLTQLSLRQADGNPPCGVEDRKRAEHNKENDFVHVRVNVGACAVAVNAIKRRGRRSSSREDHIAPYRLGDGASCRVGVDAAVVAHQLQGHRRRLRKGHRRRPGSARPSGKSGYGRGQLRRHADSRPR
jgi:hypothetical protein